MPKEIFDYMRDQNNNYSRDVSGESIEVTTLEIEHFVEILFYMSVVSLPAYRMYWCDNTRIDQIANVMARNRLEQIKRYFHLCDNTELTTTITTTTRIGRKRITKEQVIPSEKSKDKLFKVRTLLDHVRTRCQTIPAEETHAIDEQIIPYKVQNNNTLPLIYYIRIITLILFILG